VEAGKRVGLDVKSIEGELTGGLDGAAQAVTQSSNTTSNFVIRYFIDHTFAPFPIKCPDYNRADSFTDHHSFTMPYNFGTRAATKTSGNPDFDYQIPYKKSLINADCSLYGLV